MMTEAGVRWYDLFFLALLLASAGCVARDAPKYAACERPLLAWLLADYAAIFAFRALCLTYGVLGTETVVLSGGGRSSEAWAARRKALRLALLALCLLLLPALLAWSLLGAVWVVQGGTCLPDDGQQWAVLAWVVYSLGVLFAIATFAVAKVITYRRASSVGRTLSIERQITPAQRQAAEGEGEGEGDEESGNPRRRRGSAGSAEARASSGSRAGAPAEAATGTAANEGGQTRASVSRLKAHVQALVAKLDFLARALAHHEDINAIANALLGQLEMAAQGGAPNGATPRASNGLSAEQIAGLPTARVAERFFDPDAASKDAGGNAEAETCPICLDVLEAGDEVRELPCEHIFHLECVDEWLAREATCPRCRHRADAPSSGRPSISGSARPSLVDRSSPRSSLGAAMPTVEAAQGSLPRAPTSSALRLSPLQPAPRTPLPSAPSRSRLSQEGDYGERSSSVDRDTAAASVASWLAVTSLEASPVHGAPGVLGDGRGDDLDYASEGGVRSEQRNES